MATFQVLEDSPRENIEPLDKIVKGKNFVEKDTERRALQVLGNVKQNKIKNTKVLPTKQTSTAPVIKHQSNHNQKKEDKNDGNRTKNQRPQITSSDMCSYQPPAVTRKRGVLHLVSASPLEEEYEDVCTYLNILVCFAKKDDYLLTYFLRLTFYSIHRIFGTIY